MKMIFLWAALTFVVAFRARRVDRWLVLLYVGLCLANVLFAYVGF